MGAARRRARQTSCRMASASRLRSGCRPDIRAGPGGDMPPESVVGDRSGDGCAPPPHVVLLFDARSRAAPERSASNFPVGPPCRWRGSDGSALCLKFWQINPVEKISKPDLSTRRPAPACCAGLPHVRRAYSSAGRICGVGAAGGVLAGRKPRCWRPCRVKAANPG